MHRGDNRPFGRIWGEEGGLLSPARAPIRRTTKEKKARRRRTGSIEVDDDDANINIGDALSGQHTKMEDTNTCTTSKISSSPSPSPSPSRSPSPSSPIVISKNAQKRAARKQGQKEKKDAKLARLLVSRQREEEEEAATSNGAPPVSTQTSKNNNPSGGKACRARRARNGETDVGNCDDHRPSGGAPLVSAVKNEHISIVLALEQRETIARVKFRPELKERKVVPTDNHGSMEVQLRQPTNNAQSHSISTITLESGIQVPACSLSERNLRSFSISLVPITETFPLGSLVCLDLCRNELWDLPDDLSALVNLSKLDLSRNWFRDLPQSIAQLRRLKSLHASHNMLRASRPSLRLEILKGLPLLEFLDISFNQKCGKQTLADLLHSELPRVDLNITISFPPPQGAFVGGSAAERDATLLRSQLEPWSTTALRRRLVADFGDEVSPPEVPRAAVMERLLQLYQTEEENGKRVAVHVDGRLVDEGTRDQLLVALRAWVGDAVGGNQERTSIKAKNYMILASPAEYMIGSKKAAKAAAKLQTHKTIWDLCVHMLCLLIYEDARPTVVRYS
jgi:hypothetical protein